MNEITKKLADFIKQDDNKASTYEVIISERFKDIPFTIRPMKFSEYSKYQSNASKVKFKSKDTSINTTTFFTEVILNHTVEPNFKSTEFLAETGYPSGEEFILNELKIDEITNLGNAILDISGVTNDYETVITEAKNS